MLIISLIVRQTQVIPKKTITFMALENWHTKVNIYILVKQVQEVMVGWMDELSVARINVDAVPVP